MAVLKKVVVAIGGLAVIADPFSVDVGDLAVPLLLIAGGVWFLDRRPDLQPPSGPRIPQAPAGVAADPGWASAPVPTTGGATAVLDPPAPAHWATPNTPEPIHRPPVATIAIAATAALLGLAVLLDSFDAIDPDPVVYAAIPCLGFGAGVVAAALIRGARSGLLILLSLASLVPLSIAALAGPAVFGGVGSASTIVIGEAPASDYTWGIGEHVIDLRDATIVGVHDVDVDQSFGSARIIVPADVTVEVDAAVSGGTATVFGVSSEGTDVRLQRSFEVDAGELDGADDVLRLDVDLQFGEIVVVR